MSGISYVGRSLYDGLIMIGNSLQSVVLLGLRLFFGYQFIKTGLGKILHLSDVGTYFATLDIPFPLFSTFLVGCIECIGGLCLLLGLYSRLAALALVFVMLGALWFADQGVVLGAFKNVNALLSASPTIFLLTSLIIFVCGPGKFSLDAFIRQRQ